MFLKIFISSLSLLIFSFTNASAQIMHIHTGGEEQAFDLADVDSINFVEEEQHFIFEITGTNMSILITAALLNGESLVENDEIGVFTPDGICAGGRVVPATFPEEQLGLAAWGGEQGQANGFHNREALSFRYWDDSSSQEIVADLEIVGAGEAVWVNDGIITIRLFSDIEE